MNSRLYSEHRKQVQHVDVRGVPCENQQGMYVCDKALVQDTV